MSENAVKRLRWRCRRGMRELDLVLESYLARHSPTMNATELDVFTRFLDSTDMDLYDWITGRAKPQEHAFGAIVAELMQRRN